MDDQIGLSRNKHYNFGFVFNGETQLRARNRIYVTFTDSSGTDKQAINSCILPKKLTRQTYNVINFRLGNSNAFSC